MDDLSLAKNVIAKAEIVSVRLVSSHTDSTVRDLLEVGSDPVPLRQGSKISHTERGFRALIELGISLPGKGEGAPLAVSIDSTFEVEYTLPSDLNASDEELNAFARVNGLFNAWPYFREFVQASMARMQLPPLILPLLRVPRRTEASSSSPAEKPLALGDTPQTSATPSEEASPVNPTSPNVRPESSS